MPARLPWVALWACLAFALMVPGAARAAEPERLAASARFAVYCQVDAPCENLGDPEAAARAILDDTEAAYDWLEGLGFPMDQTTLEKAYGKWPIYFTEAADDDKDSKCGDANALACARPGIYNAKRLFLIPLDRVKAVQKDPATLAHELMHTVQPLVSSLKGTDWMTEAPPTAIGTMFPEALAEWGTGLYPPKYLMSLDRPFYDVVDPGYGNWAYLLFVGEAIGSTDFVAYLSAPAVLNVARTYRGRPPSALMELFYDSRIVGSETFDKGFPRFVSSFNNLESQAVQESDDGGLYNYYTEVRTVRFRVPDVTQPVWETYEDSAPTYAVAPILADLSVDVPAGTEPKDALMMARIEVVTGDPVEDLSLVIEHKRADAPRKEAFMIAGTEPPDALGFLRVVNAPAQPPDAVGRNAFDLRIEATPVSLVAPNCFRAGVPAQLGAVGFGPEEGNNWRLQTDNGTAAGVTVTPAHPGKMTLSVEIDSPITRQTGTLDPKTPHTATVALGTYDVAADACMIRITVGDSTLTYSPIGAYTMASAPGGRSIFFGPHDIAIRSEEGWMPMPEAAKQMLLSQMTANLPSGRTGAGSAEPEGMFMAHMPKTYAQRFSWSRLREAYAARGRPLSRQEAACPDGGEGCTTTTIGPVGEPVPVTFDAQGRPLAVVFGGQPMRFEYGSWPMQKPPGF